MEKQNLTQQKHTFTDQKKCTTIQNIHKELKPGLVASYDIRPGNGLGLVWFRRFINLSVNYLLTYTLTHLLTAPDGAQQLKDTTQHRTVLKIFPLICSVAWMEVPILN